MRNLRLARTASMVCLAGAAVQVLYGLLAIRFHYWESGYEWAEAMWAVACAGMIGGALGLLALDVARPRWLAWLGAALSTLGNVLRIAMSVLLIVAPANADSYVPFILLSILLMVLGMGALGVGTLLGRHLSGWRAWTPLLAGGCALAIAPTYSIDLYVHFILLGLWGVAWLLLGYIVFTRSAGRELPGQAPSTTPGGVEPV